MNKSTRRLLLLFLVIGSITAIGYWLKTRNSGTNISDMQFAVPDTASVYKVFIVDRDSRGGTLERTSSGWTYTNVQTHQTYHARSGAVKTLLETIEGVSIRMQVNPEAMPNVVREIAGTGIKVMIYDRSNTLLKTYYVGGEAQGYEGTYFMMEGQEKPFVVYLTGFVGYLTTRYSVDEQDWRDKAIFHLPAKAIETLSVQYTDTLQRNYSFIIHKKDAENYEVMPFYPEFPMSSDPVVQGNVRAYLERYQQIAAEGFSKKWMNLDSIQHTRPFSIITVKTSDGETKEAKFYTIRPKTPEEGAGPREQMLRYLVFLNQPKEALIAQNLVVQKLLISYAFFVGH